MKRVRLTISVDPGVAEYIRSAPNASLLVAEAVEAYRARALERELEDAYREDAEETARLNAEWESTDAEISE
jgi:phosphate uptake regulator